jgi:hypothetical protein
MRSVLDGFRPTPDNEGARESPPAVRLPVALSWRARARGASSQSAARSAPCGGAQRSRLDDGEAVANKRIDAALLAA